MSGLRSVWLILLPLLAGCVGFGGLATGLSDAISNQRDPEIVRDGGPAYLILMDGLIEADPEDADLLLAGSGLYSAYASAFVDQAGRAKHMSTKALEYARRAVCEERKSICAAMSRPADEYARVLAEVDNADDVPYLYALGSTWAGWIQAHAADWQAIAELPKVQLTIERVLVLDEQYEHANAHLYMGVLLTLRPAPLGGQPDIGRRHFERAIELSEGRNLMAKVLYARHYARLVFDRELHDTLLQEVLASPVEVQGLTLANTLAQQQARELLATSAEYF